MRATFRLWDKNGDGLVMSSERGLGFKGLQICLALSFLSFQGYPAVAIGLDAKGFRGSGFRVSGFRVLGFRFLG